MTPLFRLLYNIFYNLIGYRTKKQLFIILASLYIPLRIYLKNKQKLKELQLQRHIQIQDRPLITFSGGGQLSFYYQGISAYLRDNFDLQDVRFAGISAGSSAAASLASRLPTEASMIFGLRWFKMLSQRPLKLFLLPPSLFIQAGQSICQEFGITDEWIKEQSQGRTDSLYYGVTNFSCWPPKHELVSDFQSTKESFYAMSCSMRVLPFFSKPGYLRDMMVLDGGLSAMFSVPADANPDKIIRITPSSRVAADIQPNRYGGECFQWMDVVFMPSLQQVYNQFEMGYNDAIRCRPKLIAKGLKLKSEQDGGGYNNKLEFHMETLKKHGKAVFFDVEELRKQDFSHFLPTSPPSAPSILPYKDR